MVIKKMTNKNAYKTIRIYEVDHELLLKHFDKNNNWAEIINILVTKLYREGKK